MVCVVQLLPEPIVNFNETAGAAMALGVQARIVRIPRIVLFIDGS